MNRNLLPISDVLNRPFEMPDEIDEAVETGQQSANNIITTHSFLLGDIGFLLPANMVCEVAQDLPICRLPRVPSWLWGMVNLRGNLLPVFDISELFNFGQSDSSKYKLLVIHIGDDMVGIVIDKLPKRVTLENENKLSGQPLLPASLQMYSRFCYEKDNCIWVDWNIEGFFTSLTSHW